MSEMSKILFQKELETTKDWLFKTALPLWSGLATDNAKGGFFERLTPEGEILHDARRTRLVARQIYVFATAHSLGWQGPAIERVEHGLAFLMAHCWLNGGKLAASYDPVTESVDARFQLYDYAFTLFGLCAAARALPKRATEFETAAFALLNEIEAHRAASGGYFDQADSLHSNPHMHLLEAAIAWTRISSSPKWTTLAASLVSLCEKHFVDFDCMAIREHFSIDWAVSDGQNPIEPGHLFEWAWLLMDWAPIGASPRSSTLGKQLVHTAETHGVGPYGLAVNEISAAMDTIDARHRLWPQTERIKAHTAICHLANNDAERNASLQKISLCLKNMRLFFAHPVSGQWWEHLSPEGKPVSEPSRASSLYHIVCAISEADKLSQKLNQTSMAVA